MPEICFLVVGDGPQLEELGIAVKKRKLQNTIYLTGKQGDIRPFYAASDISYQPIRRLTEHNQGKETCLFLFPDSEYLL